MIDPKAHGRVTNRIYVYYKLHGLNLSVVVIFNSDKNAHKRGWKCSERAKRKLNYKIFNSTWSLSGAQNILNLNVKSLKMNQHTTAHKSLWADYIYVTSGQAKNIKYE